MSIATLVHETANAPGTNVTFNLAGNVAGRRSFAMAFATGAPAYYFLVDGVQSEWGLGTFTAGAPNTLARTTVYGNSAGTTARLNFTGAVDVYNTAPAETALYLGSEWAGAGGGTANAIAVTTTSVWPSSVPAGARVSFLSTAANTGAVTLNVNGLGAVALNKGDGTTALAAGDIPGAGYAVAAQYDGTRWRLASVSSGVGTSLHSALTAAAARAVIGAPAIPVNGGTGPGAFAQQAPGVGAAWTLPAGGTWAFYATLFNSGGALAGLVGGVSAGGTTVGGAASGLSWVGFAWRIA